MGYYTRVTGQLIINPPLTWREVKEWDSGCTDMITLEVVEESVDTDEGQLVRKQGTALNAYQGQSKAYGFVEMVQKFVNLYRGAHTFTGRFEAEGEDNIDMWRLEIVNGHTVTTKMNPIWPEDLAELREALNTADQHTAEVGAELLRDAVTAFLARMDEVATSIVR